MDNLHQEKNYKILKRHENRGVKFSSTKLNTKTLIEDVIFSDFMQGDIGNCGLISSLALLSQRPEFRNEIAPTIVQTSQGAKLRFNMFSRGHPTTVTVDDTLPFAPDIHNTTEGIILNNDMIFKGKLKILTICDVIASEIFVSIFHCLRWIKIVPTFLTTFLEGACVKLIGKHFHLFYARSARDENFCLAPFF